MCGILKCELIVSRDSSVGSRSGRLGFNSRQWLNFCFFHSVQTGSKSRSASYPVCTDWDFLGDKAARAWSWQLIVLTWPRHSLIYTYSEPVRPYTSPSKVKQNSVASVRKRTIPTERPPLVSEVSANFLRIEGYHVVSVTNPYGRILGFLGRNRYCFFQVAPQLYSRGRVDPVPDPLLFFVVPGNRTRDLRICTQELWPLDHRGGQSKVK
jgi:hypothetical protein